MGTAPKRTDDLETIIGDLQAELPDLEWEQLEVKWPADDDGIWFLWRPGGQHGDVQIESSSGRCPFVIESRFNDERLVGDTPSQVVGHVLALLR